MNKPKHQQRTRKPVRPSVSGTGGAAPLDQGASDETLLTRRRFLYGAAGVGAAAAIGAGVYAIRSASDAEKGTTINVGDVEVPVLEVPEGALTTLNDFQDLESAEGHVQLVGNFDLPYGTLVWVTDDSVAACLLPTDSGSPLSQVGLLSLGNGTMTTALKKAVGTKDHFEIYDVRATSSGLIWTEANIRNGTWRVYCAKTSGNTPGKSKLLEEGNDAYETPTLAVCKNRCFWQVLPKLPNDAGLTSRLMGATFGKDDATCVYESARRMGTPPYSAGDAVVISPRVDSPTVYHQLTCIDAESGQVSDQLTLPHGMAPLEAAYGTTGFAFSFGNIYDYGGGISNLGTYTPLKRPDGGDYGNASWFGFARTPSAAPAWSSNLLIVKSSYSVCGVDLAAGTYFALDVENGADSYGEYLASQGTRDTFVTFTNIDHQPVNAKETHACRVKVWTPISGGSTQKRADSDEDGYYDDNGEWHDYADESGLTMDPQTISLDGETPEPEIEA